MSPEKISRKAESLFEKLDALELDAEDPNFAEFHGVKSDALLLIQELEEIADRSAELAAYEAPAPEDEE
jgi:hypothetical protein